jgi:hypothetical protein
MIPDKQLDIIKDKRTDCYSVMLSYSIKEYLELVESAYENKGGLKKQRTALKTSTARRIRDRMVSDLQSGAIFPPVVLGIVFPKDEDVEKIGEISKFKTRISELRASSITIIDGMQRTTAMLEVDRTLIKHREQHENYLNHTQVRVEYWIAKSINSLIYRMLVLNTGQVPWNLRRQIEVVFNSIIEEIKTSNLPLEIFEIDDSKQRRNGGQYQANNLIELFMAFGLRKEKVNVQEELADEFSRLDFIAATSNTRFTENFKKMFDYFVKLNIAFSKYCPENTEGHYKIGRNIFDSKPASIGFIVACAVNIMGRPGIEREQPEKEKRLTELSIGISSFLEKLANLTEESLLGEFLDLTTLNEALSRKEAKRFGDYERAFFLTAFETLIKENFDLPSMTVCWRAY